tara:strand:+ start:628 stop:891 length:264 start_codon:yes stop_codon:yes gene_type:complete
VGSKVWVLEGFQKPQNVSFHQSREIAKIGAIDEKQKFWNFGSRHCTNFYKNKLLLIIFTALVLVLICADLVQQSYHKRSFNHLFVVD